jgi:hypothetical protein
MRVVGVKGLVQCGKGDELCVTFSNRLNQYWTSM